MTSFSVPNVESAALELDRDVSIQRPTWDPIVKRAFDLFIAGTITLTILIWLIPLLALLIKITSRGPAFFIQVRSGRGGQQFRCLKFRTMTYNPQAQFEQAKKHDSRVTSIGRVLRRSNLDELPQFINVLVGHMSVVGPRPHPIPLDAQYWYTMPGYRQRYAVKPGITGLAQVRGARGETREQHLMKRRVRYDHVYIRRQTVFLDARICWWTVKAAMNGNPNAW